MPVPTSILLVLSLVLAVVVGPNVEQTIWGPALLALGAASVCAAIGLWRRKATPDQLGLSALGLMTCLWIAWRATLSPVAEWAEADALLLAAAVSTFVCLKSCAGDPRAESILRYGVALLLLACVIVIGLQVADPSFRVLYAYGSKSTFAAGFYTQYNHCANFLIGASLLTLAGACLGPDRRTVRIALAVIGILGLAAVWFTKSRGGMLGAAVGMGVFCSGILLLGHRRKAKWFPAAAIAFPIIGLALGILLMIAWQDAQEARSINGAAATLSGLMDNMSRLQLLGIAVSCIGLHPLIGGGSRSFAWESLQAWDAKESGFRNTIPEFVHNEWLQAFTDYGLIGGGLLLVPLFAIGIRACLHLLFDPSGSKDSHLDAWRLGGLAAMAGVGTQACFSFVFHMLPDVMLLGAFMAMASTGQRRMLSGTLRHAQVALWLVPLLASLAFFMPPALRSAQVTVLTALPIHGKHAERLSPHEKIAALDRGIALMPMATMHHRRGLLHQELALQSADEAKLHHAQLAAADYESALELNPYHGDSLVNLANTLSHLGNANEAEAAYERLIRFQGGLEAVYRGHYHFALHWQRKGIRQMNGADPDAAVFSLRQAVHHVDQAMDTVGPHLMGATGRSLQISCHEMLGMLLEAKNQQDEALVCYEHAAGMHGNGGLHVHFRSAALLAKQANTLWFSREPQKALALFLQARQKAQQSHGRLPEGISTEQRDTFNRKLNHAIQTLQSAGIQAD